MLYSYSDFAILLRTRRQIDELERAMISNRIPYRIINSKGLWEKKESAIFLDYIRILCQDNCSLALLRCLQFTIKGLGPTSINKIKSILETGPQNSSIKVLQSALRNSGFLSKNISSSITAFISFVNDIRNICENSKSHEDLKKIFEIIYNQGMLYKTVTKSTKDNLSNLPAPQFSAFLANEHPTMFKVYQHFTTYEVNEADEYVAVVQEGEQRNALKVLRNEPDINGTYLLELLRSFTKAISLYSSEEDKSTAFGNETAENDRVTISTIHAAKGLEWPVCFIPSINEGLIPFTSKNTLQRLEDIAETKRANSPEAETKNVDIADNQNPSSINYTDVLENANATEESENNLCEERRIFFVALTRAKHLLYLSSSGRKSTFLDNCEDVYSSNNLFSDPKKIIEFYQSIGRPFEKSSILFSLKTLCTDYQKFKKSKSRSMFWNGSNIGNGALVNYNNNNDAVHKVPSKSAFTAARNLLENGLPVSHMKRKLPYDTSTYSHSKEISDNSKSSPNIRINTSENKKARITLDVILKKSSKIQVQSSTATAHSKATSTYPKSERNFKSSFAPKAKSGINPLQNATVKKSFAPAYTPVRNNANGTRLNKTNCKKINDKSLNLKHR